MSKCIVAPRVALQVCLSLGLCLGAVFAATPTTTTLTSSLNPSTYGQNITLTATVTAGATGSVDFSDNGQVIATVSLSNGTAILNYSQLPGGTQTLSAAYSGDFTYAPSNSGNSLSQVVTLSSTTVSLAVAPNPSVYGQSLNLTATVTAVAPGAGLPGGTVIFNYTGTSSGSFGSVTLSGSPSVAILNTSTALPVGNYTISASYSGNSNFKGNTSNSVAETVNQGTVKVTFASSANPSVWGQAVVLTANVTAISPASGQVGNTDTVTFFDTTANTTLGSVAVVGGVASLTVPSGALPQFSVGTHNLTATYNGGASFSSALPVNLTQVVNQSATTTTLTSTPNPDAQGFPVNFTAVVAAVAPGMGTPTGTVTFNDGSTPIAANVPLVNGSASFSTTTLSVGDHTITAVYNGDTNFSTSTSAIIVEQIRNATSTSLTSGVNPSIYGQAINLTATVTSGAGIPTGSVKFFDGATLLNTVSLVNGVAVFSSPLLSVQSLPHNLTAVYVGDPTFLTSTSAVVSQTVNQSQSSVSAPIVNPASTVYSQQATISVTVSAVFPGSGTPTGNVQFKVNGLNLGTPVALASGVATLTNTRLLPTNPNDQVTAVYLGDTNFSASTSSATSVAVSKAPTLTTIPGIPPAIVYGQIIGQPPPSPYVVTVAPDPASGADPTAIPTGTVTMTADGTQVGSGTLVNGKFTFTNFTLGTGSHNIVITYSGDLNFLSSMSSNTQTVNQAATTLALVSSSNPSFVNASVKFTATLSVTAPGAGSPTGTVQFYDNGATLGAPVNLVNGQAQLTTTFAGPPADHPITATYSGDTNFSTATSNAVNQQVRFNSSITLSPITNNPSKFGEAVTITATINTSGNGTPSGTVTFNDNGVFLASAAVSGNTVISAPITSLSVGTHLITAIYSGDNNFVSSSTSSGITQSVQQDGTTTALALSGGPNPSVYGQTLTFTVTVTANAPGSGTPGGQVSLMDSATTVGTAILSGGMATFSIPNFSTGVHSLTATYGGSTDFVGSQTSTALPQTVNKASVSVNLSSSNGTSVYGEPVTFTATINVAVPSGAVGSLLPSGQVQFSVNGATQVVNVSTTGGVSTATITPPTLPITGATVFATYIGDINYTGATSNTVNQTVNQALTSLTITSSINPMVVGNQISLTAVLGITPPGAGVPTGTILFFDNGIQFTQSAIPAAAPFSVTVPYTTSVPGAHTIDVKYAGDTNFMGFDTSTVPASELHETVLQTSAITVYSDGEASPPTPPSTSVFGQPVIFSAQVTPSAATGTVTFKDNGNTIGTGTLNGSGVASIPAISTLTTGSHTITAIYGGDNTYAGVSNILSGGHNVNQELTNTTVNSSSSTAVTGQAVTFTATIAPTPYAGNPTGSVTFTIKDSQNNIQTKNVSVAGGIATYSTSALQVAGSPYTITANYSGDTNYFSSNNSPLPFTQIIAQANTTVSVTTSPSPSVLGQAVVLTANINVTSPGNGVPTGSVTFTVGTTAQTPVQVSNGVATLLIPSPAAVFLVGGNNVTATYSGDASFLGSSTSGPVVQQVNKLPTTTVVSADINPSTVGQTVTFTANVSINPPGVGTLGPATTVTFYDGLNPISGPLTLTNGSVSFPTSTLAAGQHQITAQFSGDGNSNSSTSAPFNESVRSNTTVTLTSSLNPSVAGQSVIFTATVSGSPGLPGGSVNFFDGAALLGSGAVSGNPATATFTTTTLSGGSHQITAVYAGDSNFNPSMPSNTVAQVVQKSATTTTVVAAPASILVGQSATLTATVVPVSPGSGTVDGTVTFTDTTNNVVLGTATLSGTPGVATLTTTGLITAGTAVIVSAVYNGDSSTASYNASPAATTQETVNQASSTVAIASSANPSVFGQTVNIVATVSPVAPAGGSPGGTVTFTIDGAPQAPVTVTNGVGTLTTSTLPISAAGHSVSAVYNGDANFKTSSTAAALSQVVIPVSTATTLTSSVNPSKLGQSVTFTATVVSVAPGSGTPSGGVVFSIDGTQQNPQNPLPLSGTGTATFTTAGLSPGSHSISVHYNGNNQFTLSDSPALTQVVNDNAPIATNQTVGTSQNIPVTITLSGTDPDGNPIAGFAIVSQPANGTVGGTNGVVTYVPNAGFSGTDTFTFTVTDGFKVSAPGTITVIVAPPPTFQSPPAIGPNPVVAGQPVTFSAAAVDPNGTASSITWNFGDGTTASGNNVSHTFTAPGAYVVTVTATSAAGVPNVIQQVVFVGFGLSGGATPGGVVVVGTGGAGRAQGGAAVLSVNYTKRDRTSFTGALGTIKFPSTVTQDSLVGQAGTLTIGAGSLAQAYAFTLTSSGKGSATGLQNIQISVSKQTIKFKAGGRAELTDYIESIGGKFGASQPTLQIPVTIKVGSQVFIGMLYKLNYVQRGNAGHGTLSK